MGKLLVSTPLGPTDLSYCGLPEYMGQPTYSSLFEVTNIEIRPETTFKDMVFTVTGLVATTTTGELWANSNHFYDFLGQYWATFGATHGRGDTLMQLAPSGYDACYGWGFILDGVWVTKTDGTLHYSGDYFWGCGLPDTPEFNGGAYGIHQVGSETIWSNLKHIFGSDGYWRSFFSFNDNTVLVAGNNNYGALGNTYYTDDTAHVTYPIPFVSTPQAIELTNDGWHSGSFFRTSANELYRISFNNTLGHVEYTLSDTNVTRLFGGSSNWFICYEKTDGVLYRRDLLTENVIQIHPGPIHHVFVDSLWGVVSITRTDGIVDVFEDEGIPLYENIFPGQSIIKTTNAQGLIVGLTGSLAPQYTNTSSSITTSAITTDVLTGVDGYHLRVGELHTPHISFLSTGEILANHKAV